MSLRLKAFLLAVALPSLVMGLAGAELGKSAATAVAQEAPPAEDPHAKSVALFGQVGKVLLHPRCVNCHPSGDIPTQGEDMHRHQPPVSRGSDGLGMVGMRCNTCHQSENVNEARIPGNPKWGLAPIEMAWEGKSLGYICNQIKDPARNGGRTLEQLIEHNAHDELVGYGWAPGAGRQPVPGTQEEFGKIFADWVASGAACPPT